MTFTFEFKFRACSIAAFGVISTLLLSVPPLWAQLPGSLGGALGGLGGGLPSVAQTGAANTAGVLQYCVQNNYLSGGVAGPAKDALLGQVPGAGQSSDFMAGSSGLLQTGNGQSFNLGGGGDSGGLTSQVTHKVCDMVLQHAKSLL
jgi:hypothetical protein